MATPSAQQLVGDALAAAQNSDGGFGYYPGKASRVEPTAWAALTPQPAAARARAWLAGAQSTDGWVRDDRRAPVNYAFNALSAIALLVTPETRAEAERIGDALLQVRGVAYPPSPVVRQDNSLQAWSWVEGTSSWIEPTACCLLAVKRARTLGLLDRATHTAGARIDVAERMLRDRACASGGWNYGNAQVFDAHLLAHVPTTALALLAVQDRRPAPYVESGLRFLAAQSSVERSGFALALSTLCLRRYGQPTDRLMALIAAQLPVSVPLANVVTLATLSVVLSDADEALAPFTVAT